MCPKIFSKYFLLLKHHVILTRVVKGTAAPTPQPLLMEIITNAQVRDPFHPECVGCKPEALPVNNDLFIFSGA